MPPHTVSVKIMFLLCFTASQIGETWIKVSVFLISSIFPAFTADPWYLDETACTHWPCTRAPVNTRPVGARADTHTHTNTQRWVNKWQSDGNYGPGWNNGNNGQAAPMFSLIKAEFSATRNNNPLNKMKCLQVHAWAQGGLNGCWSPRTPSKTRWGSWGTAHTTNQPHERKIFAFVSNQSIKTINQWQCSDNFESVYSLI